MKTKLLVLNVVGLTKNLICDHTPFLQEYITKNSYGFIDVDAPALTCTTQSTFLTGSNPEDHGIVGNGWFNHELNEVLFWKQSNNLVNGEMIWDSCKKKDPTFTSAQLFWWYNMYNTADWSVTPRPLYPADGRKIPDIYSNYEELRHELTQVLGTFPLFNFWGPNANIKSSEWIAECALYIHKTKKPDLNLVYLPHLDYCLQKFGPNTNKIAKELKEIDNLIKKIVETVEKENVKIIILSEYGITEVNETIHINKILRKNGYLKVKKELSYEQLDPGASEAFAVSDHQCAHVYIKNKKLIPEIKTLLKNIHGIEQILDQSEQKKQGMYHHRSGDLFLISQKNYWFSYYFWLDDKLAPDYAKTVDIHRKPGYDPMELFINPKLKFPKLKIISKLLKKKLGFRSLLDIISFDTSLVKGSHGRKSCTPEEGPILISSKGNLPKFIKANEIKNLMETHIFN